MCLDVTIFLLFVRLLEFLNVAAVADKALSCPLSSAKQRSCYRVITYKLINRIEQPRTCPHTWIINYRWIISHFWFLLESRPGAPHMCAIDPNSNADLCKLRNGVCMRERMRGMRHATRMRRQRRVHLDCLELTGRWLGSSEWRVRRSTYGSGCRLRNPGRTTVHAWDRTISHAGVQQLSPLVTRMSHLRAIGDDDGDDGDDDDRNLVEF